MFDRYWEDLTLGACATYGTVTVTEELVTGFVALTGDRHPLHLDQDFARHSRYGQRVAPGFLVLALAFNLIPTRPDTALAFYGMSDVRFTSPTFIGDLLQARVVVSDRTAKSVGGLLDAVLIVLNQRQETVAVAALRLLVASRGPVRPAATLTPGETR